MNRIRDELRRTNARPAMATPDEREHQRGRSPLKDVIRLETFERCEAALGRLSETDREAIIGRLTYPSR